MPNALTLALGIALVGVVVYALGVDRTKEATSRAGGGLKRAAKSSYGLAAAGATSGLVAGDALMQFVASDPATLAAGLLGGIGTLSLGGVLDLSATQYALIAVFVLVGYYALFTEATEEDG